MHDGAAPIAFDMCSLSLVRTTPAHLTDLGAGQNPFGKAVESLPKLLHKGRIAEVDKGIPQASLRPKIDRKIQKIELALEALLIQ